MLATMCPFFLRGLNISGEEWLEMPAPAEPESDVSSSSSGANLSASPRKGGKGKGAGSVPNSPSRLRAGDESAAEKLLTRSPKQVRAQGGGLREVRERIRREMESMD